MGNGGEAGWRASLTGALLRDGPLGGEDVAVEGIGRPAASVEASPGGKGDSHAALSRVVLGCFVTRCRERRARTLGLR